MRIMRIVVLLVTTIAALSLKHSSPGDPFLAASLVMTFLVFSEGK